LELLEVSDLLPFEKRLNSQKPTKIAIIHFTDDFWEFHQTPSPFMG
jgi:hypothetical protein